MRGTLSRSDRALSDSQLSRDVCDCGVFNAGVLRADLQVTSNEAFFAY